MLQVCADSSDIDATLMVQSTAMPEQTRKERLDELSAFLGKKNLNVVAISGRHHHLEVQKDVARGICFDVDISFAGHIEIHKSHEVKRCFMDVDVKGRFAFKLPLLVKVWATKCNMKSKSGFLSSHAWMLLVIRHTTSDPAKASVVGFFEWFTSNYAPGRLDWVIGKGDAPLAFEQENAAAWVDIGKRRFIHGAACAALRDLLHDKVPWTSAKPWLPTR